MAKIVFCFAALCIFGGCSALILPNSLSIVGESAELHILPSPLSIIKETAEVLTTKLELLFHIPKRPNQICDIEDHPDQIRDILKLKLNSVHHILHSAFQGLDGLIKIGNPLDVLKSVTTQCVDIIEDIIRLVGKKIGFAASAQFDVHASFEGEFLFNLKNLLKPIKEIEHEHDLKHCVHAYVDAIECIRNIIYDAKRCGLYAIAEAFDKVETLIRLKIEILKVAHKCTERLPKFLGRHDLLIDCVQDGVSVIVEEVAVCVEGIEEILETGYCVIEAKKGIRDAVWEAKRELEKCIEY